MVSEARLMPTKGFWPTRGLLVIGAFASEIDRQGHEIS